MGCGASSQPAADNKLKDGASPGSSNPPPVEGTNTVENFKHDTPSPSPTVDVQGTTTPLHKQEPSPAPTIHGHHGIDTHHSETLPSYSAPSMTAGPGRGSPGRGSPGLDPYQQQRPGGQALAPAYKLENESRKIGGFDPEAFRKANQKHDGNERSHDWTGPSAGPSDANQNQGTGNHSGWGGQGMHGGHQGGSFGGTGGQPSGPGYNPSGGYNGGRGYDAGDGRDPHRGTQWNQRDYIQSDDVFSTDSPQAMYTNTSNPRMEFHDDTMNDPFRAPGGLGHADKARSPYGQSANKHITNEDDALMDDILGELDDV